MTPSSTPPSELEDGIDSFASSDPAGGNISKQEEASRAMNHSATMNGSSADKLDAVHAKIYET